MARRVAAGAPSPMADARPSLDAGSRELLRAHWPALDGAWAAEPFADGGRLTAALLERATEHIGLLDTRVKLRLMTAAGCLRPAAVAPNSPAPPPPPPGGCAPPPPPPPRPSAAV
eukprot:COSAG04_NODE_17297_length_473_cov_0.764706_1_plen_114_part_01